MIDGRMLGTFFDDRSLARTTVFDEWMAQDETQEARTNMASTPEASTIHAAVVQPWVVVPNATWPEDGL